MKIAAIAALAVTLVSSGCNAPPARNPEMKVQNAAPPVAVASPVPRADLSRYAGKYPFDTVDGTRFQDLPVVHAAIEAAVRDPEIRRWVLSDKTVPTTPIAVKDGALLSWGCEAHHCSAHNWTLVMRPDASAPQLCYTDDSGIRWFSNGALLAKKDPCPSGDGS
jgi:hypothetical protein